MYEEWPFVDVDLYNKIPNETQVVVDLDGPPCSRCAYWTPRYKQTFDALTKGFKFCWAHPSNRVSDFSCFEGKK